jgi:hypothetical protein
MLIWFVITPFAYLKLYFQSPNLLVSEVSQEVVKAFTFSLVFNS